MEKENPLDSETDSHPGHISAGFAVGVFISFALFRPAYLSGIAAAFLLRINKVTCLTGSWVSTPYRSAGSHSQHRLGEALLGSRPEKIILG
jgi:uncharacterized protein (DUF2062 family)